MRKSNGFTLIELLIVITIVGILAVALIPRIIGGSANARDASRQSDMQTISTGFEYYLSENGNFDDLLNNIGRVFCSDDPYLKTAFSNILKSIPGDPLADHDNAITGVCKGSYEIYLLDDNDDWVNLNRYAILAILEDPKADHEYLYNQFDETFTVYDDLVAFLTSHLYSSDDEKAGKKGFYVIY